jgi:hypothetical protein
MKISRYRLKNRTNESNHAQSALILPEQSERFERLVLDGLLGWL